MRFIVSFALIALSVSRNSVPLQAGSIVGSWEGTSLCVDKVHFPACNNEHVIYDVVAKGKARDTVTLRADKVVNGVREFMGEFDFARARDSTWVTRFENPRVKIRIVLSVRADHMTGFMTDDVSGRRVREMTLDRMRKNQGSTK